VTPSQLNAKLQEELIRQAAVHHQYEALVKLYEAAAMMNNTVLMEQYREQLHNLLDLKLDSCNSISELTRQLIRSAG
jgi:hypothetical protein